MRVYYVVTQAPDEVPDTLIIHDLHMSSRIKPSAFEPFKTSDCMWLVPGTEDQDPLSDALAGLNWGALACTHKMMSALPPKADVRVTHRHVSFGPIPEVIRRRRAR
jgi:hypothetical protein